MAKSKTNKTNRRLLILLGIFAICLTVYLLIQSSQVRPGVNYSFQSGIKYQKPTVSADRVLVSKYGHFSVVIPEGFALRDTGITIIIKNEKGTIYIIRNGTQFLSLKDYLIDSDKKSRVVIEKESKIILDGGDAVARLEHPEGNLSGRYKAYFVYKDKQVYILSTNSEALYPVLDEVARSFRYIP